MPKPTINRLDVVSVNISDLFWPNLDVVSVNISDLFWPNSELTASELFNLGFSASVFNPGLDPRLFAKPVKVKKIIKAIDKQFLIQNPDRSFVSNIFYTEVKINNQKDQRELWLSSDEFTQEQLCDLAIEAAKRFNPRVDYVKCFTITPDDSAGVSKYTLSLDPEKTAK